MWLIRRLQSNDRYAHTIQGLRTYDYRQFAGHQEIAEALDADLYFAHPYSSWKRGANENANGLLRQYVKKGTDLRTVTDNDI